VVAGGDRYAGGSDSKNPNGYRPDHGTGVSADPSRRGMVERLSRGPASVSELARPLEMSLAAVVQHLQVLEASGLVRSDKVGRVRTCRIEPAALRPAEQWISERRAGWERRLDRLGDHLAEHPDEPARERSS
jgi:DNA-binding transcriptional ArsR family regulator